MFIKRSLVDLGADMTELDAGIAPDLIAELADIVEEGDILADEEAVPLAMVKHHLDLLAVELAKAKSVYARPL